MIFRLLRETGGGRTGLFAPLVARGRSAAGLVADFLWPERCVGCDKPGTLLCEDCAANLPLIEQRYACPRCGAPFGWLVCTQCDETWDEIGQLVSALGYEGVAKALVTVYKDGHERRLAPVLAQLIASALEQSGALAKLERPLDALAFIPSTPAAYNRRGFDPMEDVARELSSRMGLPMVDVLAHEDVEDQRRLGRAERAENVRGSFVALGDLWQSRLLLIDDVVTTGASARAAAAALKSRGASVLVCASVCRVW